MRALHGIVFGETSQRQLERRLSWQFVDNPAARLLSSIHHVAVREGRMVGSTSSFPARLKLHQRVETIRVGCDLLVLPEARGQGVATKLIEAHRATVRHPLDRARHLAGALMSPGEARLLVPPGRAAVPATCQAGTLGRVAGASAARRTRRFRALRAGCRCRHWGDRQPSASCPESPEAAGGGLAAPSIRG